MCQDSSHPLQSRFLRYQQQRYGRQQDRLRCVLCGAQLALGLESYTEHFQAAHGDVLESELAAGGDATAVARKYYRRSQDPPDAGQKPDETPATSPRRANKTSTMATRASADAPTPTTPASPSASGVSSTRAVLARGASPSFQGNTQRSRAWPTASVSDASDFVRSRHPRKNPRTENTKRGTRSSGPLLIQHQQPAQSGPKRHDEVEGSVYSMLRQPETRPISHQQLVAEVKGIYKGLVLAQSAQKEDESRPELSDEKWQALGALHRDFVHEHHDFFLASQHPYATALPREPPLRRREVYVSGELAGAPAEALPDTGADGCFISPNLVSHLKLKPLPRTKTKTRLATGRSIKSPGIVQVPWRFEGEAQSYLLHCRILPGCTHPLILGNPFLQATETLSKFLHRIKSRFCSLRPKHHLRFLGGKGQRLRGYLNDQPIAALPDTGSDLMLVSGSFARRQGLKVDQSRKNRLEVEFADGSTAWTKGVVKDMEWRVGNEARHCEFYVLEGLRADVVLSSTYVFDVDVFSRYADYLVDKECHSADPELFNIRLIGRYGDRLHELEAESATDMTARDAFGPLKIQRELARRDKIRDEIRGISDAQTQAAAAAAEDMRQQRWEAARRLHRLLLSSQETPTVPNSGAVSGANRAREALSPSGMSSLEEGGEDLRLSQKTGRRRGWRRRIGALASSFAIGIIERREDMEIDDNGF